MPRSRWAWASVRFPGLLRPARTATMATIRMLARHMATMGQTGLSAACLSAPGLGITASTDPTSMAMAIMVAPAMVTMAADLGMATGRVTAMAIGRHMAAAIAEFQDAAMRVAPIRAMLPAAGMVVAAFTVVVEGSTAAEAVVFPAVVDPMAVVATDK